MGTITAINLAKAYRHYPTRWARLAEWIIPFSRPRHIKKWVLQDVNFTINAGEAIGIIGVNGAGKSTLLKMITGTTLPTVGSVHTTGRISALLELGIGFHPEFSGRQNVFMAAQLQGMTKKEILDLLPDIESFAEIGDYIDQPLRLYSSGMQVRLAFSVATAIQGCFARIVFCRGGNVGQSRAGRHTAGAGDRSCGWADYDQGDCFICAWPLLRHGIRRSQAFRTVSFSRR